MKWLIGIAVVVLITWLYFRIGTRRLELERKAREQHERQTPPEG
jgi:hypothetical protein